MKNLPICLMTMLLLSGCYKMIGFNEDGPGADVSDTNTPSKPDNKEYSGIDLLIVVDNSESMGQEQEMLATGFFTLVNSLVSSSSGSIWPYPAVADIRVAVVSSDMGLQYGENHSTEGISDDVTSATQCTGDDPRGDDGRFQIDMPSSITVESGRIPCEGNGDQCPMEGWSCSYGLCVTPSGDPETVACPDLNTGNAWAGTTGENTNGNLASQVACLGQLGTSGCGVEQQLEAAVRGLSRNDEQRAFIKDDHLLAVLIVSDEEDCSIADRGLYNTDEWISGTTLNQLEPSTGLLNTACNLPASNEDNFLFDTNRYRTELVGLKNGDEGAVIFAAIVGVPKGDNSPCQGRGNELGGCLDHGDMKLEVGLFESESGIQFKHFMTACERSEGENVVTSARPGRRYVQVARSFGGAGYIYSICNADWSPAMERITEIIAERVE